MLRLTDDYRMKTVGRSPGCGGIVAPQCCCGSTSEALHSRSKRIFIHVFMYVCKYLFIY